MLLTSPVYFVVLGALFLLYWPLARWRLACLSLVLFTNYYFYAKWNLWYLALIPLASLLDYFFALGMDRWRKRWPAVCLFGLSLLLNIAILAAFKYIPSFPLHVGLSFYTFQALSYTIDVYRGDAPAIRSLLTYLSAVSLFPTVLAGPITRPADLAPQLERIKRLLPADGGRALFLIGLGMTKKYLIADYLGENLVNRVFDTPNLYSGFEALIAVYAYAFQLYYDFSGYTDIALGSGLLLGLKLPPNFNVPYASSSLSEFWRRWHISLSTWLRDYIYFSFPGLRGTVMPFVALFITMLIGGIWHGDTWNFALWGALHGAGLVIYRLWHQFIRRPMPDLAATVLTFHFVSFTWIFFRASTFELAGEMLARIGSLTFSSANLSLPFTVVLAVAVLAHYLPKQWFLHTENLFVRSPFYVQAAALMLLIVSIQYVAATGAAPFIYTRF